MPPNSCRHSFAAWTPLRAGAVLSATVGGWLGFHAGADMLALVTTIAGAAAATNLALILVSIARERALRTSSVPERALAGVS